MLRENVLFRGNKVPEKTAERVARLLLPYMTVRQIAGCLSYWNGRPSHGGYNTWGEQGTQAPLVAVGRTVSQGGVEAGEADYGWDPTDDDVETAHILQTVYTS